MRVTPTCSSAPAGAADVAEPAGDEHPVRARAETAAIEAAVRRARDFGCSGMGVVLWWSGTALSKPD
jgi:hypothetical protein